MEAQHARTVSLECDGFNYPRAIERFAEKRVARWSIRNFGADGPSRVNAAVKFSRATGGHDVRCDVEIRHQNGGVWRAAFIGKNPHQTLDRCLDQISAPSAGLEQVLMLQRLMNMKARTA